MVTQTLLEVERFKRLKWRIGRGVKVHLKFRKTKAIHHFRKAERLYWVYLGLGPGKFSQSTHHSNGIDFLFIFY